MCSSRRQTFSTGASGKRARAPCGSNVRGSSRRRCGATCHHRPCFTAPIVAPISRWPSRRRTVTASPSTCSCGWCSRHRAGAPTPCHTRGRSVWHNSCRRPHGCWASIPAIRGRTSTAARATSQRNTASLARGGWHWRPTTPGRRRWRDTMACPPTRKRAITCVSSWEAEPPLSRREPDLIEVNLVGRMLGGIHYPPVVMIVQVAPIGLDDDPFLAQDRLKARHHTAARVGVKERVCLVEKGVELFVGETGLVPRRVRAIGQPQHLQGEGPVIPLRAGKRVFAPVGPEACSRHDAPVHPESGIAKLCCYRVAAVALPFVIEGDEFVLETLEPCLRDQAARLGRVVFHRAEIGMGGMQRAHVIIAGDGAAPLVAEFEADRVIHCQCER